MKKIDLVGLALALILLPVAAHADPITAVIAGIKAFAAASSIGAFVVRIGISMALSALSVALGKKEQNRTASGIKTDASTGGTNPQSFVLGRYATGGNLVAPAYSHPNDGSVPNKYLTYVLDISDVPGVEFSRLMLSGEYLEDLVASTGDHDLEGNFEGTIPNLFLTWHNGHQTEADAYMLANYQAHADRPWGADMVGTGVAYAVLTFVYNRKLYNSMPGVRFEVLGIPLYDPRKDTGVGGNGTHRWADSDTWEFSENNIVMVYNILRGITLPDGQVWGGRAAAVDLPLDNWFAAMNECDQSIDLAGGGTEPQYRAGLEVSVDQEPAGVIEELLKACSGEIVEIGGIYKVRVGPPALPVYFFTDDDVVVDEPQHLQPYPGLDQVHNAIHASHPSPDALWENRDAPPLYNAEWEVEDGGRQLVAEVTLPAVTSETQVQRLMAAWIKDERRFRRHGQTMPPDAAILEPLDTVAWTSAANGYSAKVFEIGEQTDNLLTMLQTVAMRERDGADFAWVAATDEIEVFHPSLATTEPQPRSLPLFDLFAHSMVDAEGTERRPALRLIWEGSSLADTDTVEFDVQLADGTLVETGFVSDPSTGEKVVSAGILPGTVYRAKARLVTRLGGIWTGWASASTDDLRIDHEDLSAQVQADISLAATVRDAHNALIEDFTRENLGALQVDYEATQLALASTLATINREIAATGPTTLGLPLEAWNYGSSPNNSAPGGKAKILDTDLVSGDADFGDCFEFRQAINANVGPAKVYDWVPGISVYAVTITFKTVDDGTGISNNHFGATLYQGDVWDSTESNQQADVGDYSVADGVQVKTVWFTDRADVIGLGGSDTGWDGVVNLDSPANADNNGVLFHFRQNASNAGTVLQRIKSIEVRDVASLATALIARNAAAGSEASAGVSETNAAGYELGANTAWAGAVSERETAVAVSSQGVGVLTDQFLPVEWTDWEAAPTRGPNEVYASGNTLEWDIGAVNGGAYLGSNFSPEIWVGSQGGATYRVEVEFELLSGSADGAGVLFDWRNSLGTTFRVQKTLDEIISEPIVIGQKMVGSFIAERPANFSGSFDYHTFFLMAGWTGFGAVAAKRIKFHRAHACPLSVTDAGVREAASAIVDLQGNASAGYLIKAQAGGAVSLLDLVAADGSAGSASVAKLDADLILLNGTVKGEHADFESLAVLNLTVDGVDIEDLAVATQHVENDAITRVYSSVGGSGNKQITVNPSVDAEYVVMCFVEAAHTGSDNQAVSCGVKLYKATSSGGTQNFFAEAFKSKAGSSGQSHSLEIFTTVVGRETITGGNTRYFRAVGTRASRIDLVVFERLK